MYKINNVYKTIFYVSDKKRLKTFWHKGQNSEIRITNRYLDINLYLYNNVDDTHPDIYNSISYMRNQKVTSVNLDLRYILNSSLNNIIIENPINFSLAVCKLKTNNDTYLFYFKNPNSHSHNRISFHISLLTDKTNAIIFDSNKKVKCIYHSIIKSNIIYKASFKNNIINNITKYLFNEWIENN